jgi:hypothetical protein
MVSSSSRKPARVRVLLGAAVVAVVGVLILSAFLVRGVPAGPVAPPSGSDTSTVASAWSVGDLQSAPLTIAPYTEPGLGLSGAINLGPATVPSLSILVSFPIQHSPELATFLAELSTPSSPLYRHYLNATEFDNAYGGSASDYNAAVAYFQSFGVAQLQKFADRLTLSFQASPAQIQQIFHTTIDQFSIGGNSYVAPITSPELPSPLTSAIASVEGLSTYSALLIHPESFGSLVRVPHWGYHFPAPSSHALSAAGYLAPVTSGGVQYEYAPDFQVAYDELSLFNDSGYPTNAVIATILWSGTNASDNPVGPFVPSDIYDFFNETLPVGEPHPHVYGVPLSGALPPGPSASYDVTGANGENTLDLEMVGSTAPGASIYNVYGPSSTYADLNGAFSYILNPTSTPGLKNVNVITNSWGGGDTNDMTWYQDLQEAQARGISVLASSGDSGDNDLSSKYDGGPDLVQFPSAMAYNDFGDTAVGGTTVILNQNPSSSGYLQLASQTAWYISAADSADGGPAGSTGGISSVIQEPSWQLGTSANTVILGGGRATPDIAAIANNTLVTISIDGYEYLASNATYGGYFESFWGTSIASPLEAGIVAEIDHVLNVHGNGPLGFLNPQLYTLANTEYSTLGSTATTGYIPTGSYASPLPTLPLLDVTTGANYVYAALPGYDLVTGWGSIDAYNYTMYVLDVPSTGIPGHLSGIQDRLDLSGLKVSSTDSSGNYNASTQQNFFLANSLGAPIYWIQNVVYIYGQPGAWQMNFTGWVIYPFYAAYPSLSVYEYNWPLSGLTESTPLNLNFTTQLTSPGTLGAQVVFSFGVAGTSALTLPVPGASFLIGSLDYSYSWQGETYTNGGPAFSPGEGFLSPQFGLVGGPSLGLGNFVPPTGGTLSAWVEPWGTSTFIPAATQTFDLTNTQTGEDASNLTFTQTGANSWAIGTHAGSQVQGVLAYEGTQYSVTFSETGLLSGTSWSVTLGGVEKTSQTSTIIFSELNWSYAYTIEDVSGWHQTTLPYTGGTAVVNGATVTEPTLVFTQVTYPVAFSESGLSVGATWYVNFTSGPSGFSLPSGSAAAGSSISLYLANGTFEYTVTTNVNGFQTTTPAGLTELAGAPPSVAVTFAPTYSVTFKETGLPSGTNWSVTLEGALVSSTTTTISFAETNGAYTYTITDISGWHQTTLPYTGTVVVSGAAVVEPTLAFTQVTYSVTFTESGLPSGTEWWVNLTNGPSFSSTTTSLSFAQPNGTHDYTVATADKNYAPLSPSSSFDVSGTSSSEVAEFAVVFYPVTVTETGLPSGTSWTVTVNGSPYEWSGSTGKLSLSNGTYPFTVGPVAGYSTNLSAGSITVKGAPAQLLITFTPTSGAATFLGLPAVEGYALLGAIVAVVLVGVVVAVVLLRRRGKAPPVPATAPSQPAESTPPAPP